MCSEPRRPGGASITLPGSGKKDGGHTPGAEAGPCRPAPTEAARDRLRGRVKGALGAVWRAFATVGGGHGRWQINTRWEQRSVGGIIRARGGGVRACRVITSKEGIMSKLLTAGLCALFITGSSLASAQTPFAGDRAAAAADARSAAAERVKQLLSVDWKALTDLRVGIVKAALQLKPDQEKYWPALEQEIRDRAAVRHRAWKI